MRALEKWLKCWRPPRPMDNSTTVDGGGSWGGGHFDPATGQTGNIPDPEDEDGWLERRRTKALNQKQVASSKEQFHDRRMRKKAIRTVPLP